MSKLLCQQPLTIIIITLKSIELQAVVELQLNRLESKIIQRMYIFPGLIMFKLDEQPRTECLFLAKTPKPQMVIIQE